MKTENVRAEFCVVGGGLAGICAAVAAARGGLKTVLVHDRPVLGGNASSEIRVWVQGATASGGNAFAREGGLLNEILLENMFRNPEANPHLFDALLLDFVTAEPNITLLANTAVFQCQTSPAGDATRIVSATAFNSNNQTRYQIDARLFADCSGDGILGFAAGADFRFGREARSEYDEPWAPERADANTLGDSMYFYSKRHRHAVKFVRPRFAIDIASAGIPQARIERIGRTAEPYGCELWWLEYGGLLDAIHDAERIRHHLTCLVYGVWDYIKNSGRIADADNLTLEWVGSMPGKREGRRFLGDHVLTQQDVLRQRVFADAIGAAGWSIDLHPSGGIYCPDAPSKHAHPDWVYNVPFRCLYSRNVENLLLAGRLISASHVAFGSIRVMGTCAMTGQAIGTAAVQCVGEGVTPRQIAVEPEQMTRLQQRLLRDGQHIVGLANCDPADLARGATVTASSVGSLDCREDDELGVRLTRGATWMVALTDLETEWVELLVDGIGPTQLTVAVRVNDRVVNFEPNVTLAELTLPVAAGRQWVRIPLLLGPRHGLREAQNVWLRLGANEAVELRCQRARTSGTLLTNGAYRAGFYQHARHTPCFRLARAQAGIYEPSNVIDGHHRPYVLPRGWVSGRLAAGAQWVELSLLRAVRVREAQITLNGDVNQLIWTQLHSADMRAMAELVRDMDVEVIGPDGAVRRYEVRDNHQQMVRLGLDGGLVERVRVACHSTWGHDRAEIVEVRLY